MLRVMCIAIIVLNTYHKDMKSNFECKAAERKSVDIGRVIKKISSLISNGVSYVGFDQWFKDKPKHTFKDDFMRNVQRGLDVLKSSGRASDLATRRYYDTFPQPVRKYKKAKSMQSAMQIIKAHGYRVQTHKILTYDGYTLTVQRIPPSSKTVSNETVILHHGLLGSSEDWLLLGTGKALPYLLSDHGYDVWLLNARGNKYSIAHDNMDVDAFEFWDFSWHEMGIYDLPAAITYISHYTQEANLYYVGHSMGGTALLVLLSTYPEYNQKLKLAILLAPLAFMTHVKGPLKYFDYYHSENNVYATENQKEFVANYSFPPSIIDRYCRGSRSTCANPLLLMTNGGKDIADPELRHNILSHVPSGGSSKTLTHYMQLIRSGSFQMYDYGMVKNLKSYNTEHPPKYNLSAINLPITVFSSASDWLATELDIALLLTKLKSLCSQDSIDDYDHFDFIWSEDATYMLYYIMIDIMGGRSSRKKVNSFVTTMIK